LTVALRLVVESTSTVGLPNSLHDTFHPLRVDNAGGNWNVSRATVYRHQQAPVVSKRRPGPLGPCNDATLLEHIEKAIAESRFTGEGYRKIWAPSAARPDGRAG
jgi:hypothetical protein